MRRHLDAVLGRFADWFQSNAGVKQCFVFFTSGVIVELIWPGLDPNHFWYLFVCTYWSAFTCNALANSSKRDADAVQAFLASIKAEEDQILEDRCKKCGH